MGNADVFKVISGGQTGVDRAGLDAAIDLDLAVGGFCPKGRRAEDGKLPAKYDFLVEVNSANYLVRTERNVVESDGTLILALKRPLTVGTERTRSLALRHSKPVMVVVGFDEADNDWMVKQIHQWLISKDIKVLNIAGSRESGFPGIQEKARFFLTKALAPFVVATSEVRRCSAHGPQA